VNVHAGGPRLCGLALAALAACGRNEAPAVSSAGTPADRAVQQPPAEPAPEPPLDDESATRVRTAVEAMSARRWEDALAVLQPLLAREPVPADVAWIAGSADFELGRYSEAAPRLDDAVKRKPAFLPAASALGFAQRELGDFAAAEATFRAIVAVRPEAHKAHYGLGLVELDQGRLPEARQEIEAALALAPDYRKARAALGRLLFEEGRLDEARAQLQRVVDDWPGNEQALYQLAQVESALGDQQAAEAALERHARVYSAKEQLGALAGRRRTGEETAAEFALEVSLRLEIGEPAEAARTLGVGLRAHPEAPELTSIRLLGAEAPGAAEDEPDDLER